MRSPPIHQLCHASDNATAVAKTASVVQINSVNFMVGRVRARAATPDVEMSVALSSTSAARSRGR